MNRAQLQSLKTALRTEGHRDPPSFSLPLHRRIMGALRTEGLPRQAPRALVPAWRSRAWRVGIPMGIAATLAIAAWIILKPKPPTFPPKNDVANGANGMPQLTIPMVPAPASPEVALENAKYAYLDRDARRLWTFVADQLPDLPSPPR